MGSFWGTSEEMPLLNQGKDFLSFPCQDMFEQLAELTHPAQLHCQCSEGVPLLLQIPSNGLNKGTMLGIASYAELLQLGQTLTCRLLTLQVVFRTLPALVKYLLLIILKIYYLFPAESRKHTRHFPDIKKMARSLLPKAS